MKKRRDQQTARYYDLEPIDSLAKRVMTRNKPKPLPDPQKVREKAERTSDPEQKRALLLEADRLEKKRRTIARRIAGPKAEARAREALEAAKWKRNNPRR